MLILNKNLIKNLINLKESLSNNENLLSIKFLLLNISNEFIYKYLKFKKNINSSHFKILVNNLSNNLAIKLFILFILTFSSFSHALTLKESLMATAKNNLDMKYYQYELSLMQNDYYKNYTEFLPKIAYNIIDGKRNFKDISNNNLSNKSYFKNQELTIEQNLFNGFQSLNNFKRIADENQLNHAKFEDKKNSIYQKVAELFSNIYWKQNIILSYSNIIELYQKTLDCNIEKLNSKIITDIEIIDTNNNLLIYRQKNDSNKLLHKNNLEEFLLLTGIDADNLEKINLDLKLINFDFINSKIQNNAILKSKKIEYKLASDERYRQISDLMPKIYLTMSFAKQNNNLYLLNQKYKNNSISLNFSLPLFQNGIEYINFKNNNDKILLDKQGYLNYFQYINLYLENFYREYKNLLKNLEINNQLVENNKKKIELIKKKLDSKIIDLNEYYKSIIDLELSKINYFQTYNNLEILYFKILSILGEINE
jgi:outer membrane protein TolC